MSSSAYTRRNDLARARGYRSLHHQTVARREVREWLTGLGYAADDATVRTMADVVAGYEPGSLSADELRGIWELVTPSPDDLAIDLNALAEWELEHKYELDADGGVIGVEW